MRSNTRVNGREVLAVATADVSSSLSVSQLSITIALKATSSGKNDEVKDFLQKGSTDTVIVCGRNSTRRRCCVIYLDTLSREEEKRIREGTY